MLSINLKIISSLIFLFLGVYFFYNEYNLLLKIKFNNIDLIKKQEIISKDNIIKNTKNNNKNEIKNKIKNIETKNNLTKFKIKVNKGDTFASILQKLNLEDQTIFSIANKVENFYDLKKLKIGQNILFFKNSFNEIKKIELKKNIDSKIIVLINNNEIIAKKEKLKKSFFQESKEFNIRESLYQDGIKNNVPQEILISLIKLYSFDLDFQRDIRANTYVAIFYDMYQIVETGDIEYNDINYARISIGGKNIEYFKFKTDEGFIDYFNKEGKNVKKSILKTPIDGARLSSNYGMRKHPISGYNKMHKGIDFAAPKGTPIYAGGNGTIEYVGKNGGYGNYIRIRHNNDYKTAYAHMSSFKKGISKGVRVNQGDVIGYVGSTGNSTGPHLHYEIIFQNKQINPNKLQLPSGKILKGKELERFKKEFKEIYADHLNLLYE